MSRLVLASWSPRRRELLATTGVQFDAVAPDIDETPFEGEAPAAYVERLARAKATAVVGQVGPDVVVVAADTTVALGTTLFAKPADTGDARRMLEALSGTTHLVHTGVVVHAPGAVRSAVVTTVVAFGPIAAADLEWYVGTGEPLDRAGAYAIQGGGGLFVRSVDGSPSNVIGLPLGVVAELLVAVGHPLSTFRRNLQEE